MKSKSTRAVVAQWGLPAELHAVFEQCPDIVQPADRTALIRHTLDSLNGGRVEVAYDVPGKGRVVEAEVVRVRNGIAVNYPEPYMRRRDPDCMVVADDLPTDKPQFAERFGKPFATWRADIMAWLATQPLMLVPFRAGSRDQGYMALLVAPENCAFFAAGLADLQGMLAAEDVPPDFAPHAIIYVAPPFRHTHCDGKQVVVHCREPERHEVFSLNLYPGPSAKKGVYGILLHMGSEEGWLTAHGSTVQVLTPYDMIVTIMHEGASGSGKSEMLEYAHRETDGRLLVGVNVVTGERRRLTLPRGCELHPVTDDMALCQSTAEPRKQRLVVSDAEDAWFLRINHIEHYGTDPLLERLCTQPAEPLMFLNLYAVPDATCLIWEPQEDAPGKPCPNPRVIVPRRLVDRIVNTPVPVDVRSFGVRTPPCTAEAPTYGIIGLLHILPPALAWLWRLVSPRGFANPSVTDTNGLSSEGVGSYWPFATGRRVEHANLLLKQIHDTPGTRYTLTPNQHIGAWKVGFMPQWIAREYLARRGGAYFPSEALLDSRCPLLGWSPSQMLVEGTPMSQWLLRVELQPEVGSAGYDAGAEELRLFFEREIRSYLDEADLDPLGRRIIECCLNRGQVRDYWELLPTTE